MNKIFTIVLGSVFIVLIGYVFAQTIGLTNTRTIDCSNVHDITSKKQTYIINGIEHEYSEQYLCKVAEYREEANTKLLLYSWNESDYIKCYVGSIEYLEDSRLITLTKSIDELRVDNCNAIGCMEVYHNEYCN